MSHAAYDPRCRFSVDDCIWFLRDVALRARDSIFENGFLRFWREMHERLGLKVQFNVYYEDLDTNWTLALMPDRFREEWVRNADWIRLTFHARSDLPPMPYRNAPAEQLEQDFLLVADQIRRFAGDELLSACTTIHWGMATREGCSALARHGIEALVGYFQLRNDEPWVAYYLDTEQTRFLSQHDTWRDEEAGILFIKHDMVLNEVPLVDVCRGLDSIFAKPDESEVLELMIHEQYFYPYFPQYQHDAALKVQQAAEWVANHGYRWAFYEDWRADG